MFRVQLLTMDGPIFPQLCLELIKLINVVVCREYRVYT